MFSMKVNVLKLTEELNTASIPIWGVSSDGRIDFQETATPAQKAQAAQILAAHDPTKPTAQEQALKDAQTALKALNAKKVSALSAADFQTLFKLWLVERGWVAADGTIQVP